MTYEITDQQLLNIRKAAGPRADYIMRIINGCRVEKPAPQRRKTKVKQEA